MKGKKILGAVPAVLALCMAMAPGGISPEVSALGENDSIEVQENVDRLSSDIFEAKVPDANFRKYILTKFDQDNSGGLSQEEMDNVRWISVNNCEISELTGIEYFSNLQTLECKGNQIQSINLSNHKDLRILECSDNQITNLDVSGCTNLEYLYCGSNQLTSLDVRDCTNLQYLLCKNNKLTQLNLRNNTALIYLWCAENQLTSLNVEGCTKLTSLRCGNVNHQSAVVLDHLCNMLTSIDVSSCTSLNELDCTCNKLTSLDVTNNTALRTLYCSNNQITELDVRKNTDLLDFYCISNQLTSLDVSENTSLWKLDSGYNQFTIIVKNDSFSLSKLPGNFDPSKASNWKGATYDSITNSLINFTSDKVIYTYDCGNDTFSSFILNVEKYVEPDPISDFVERLYVNLLGRASDPKGKANHVNSLKSGKSACDVAKNFVLSAELANKKLSNKEFVTRMYKTMLDRNPDAGGLARWTAALDNGCSYGYVLQGFGKSAEFTRLCESYGVTRGSYTSPEYRDRNEKLTAYVSRLYTVALGRKYDINGLNNHTGRYINGTKTAEEIAYSFVFSTEFKNKKLTDEQFVDCMYNSLFGRKADAGGKSRWLTRMKGGMTREQVFKGFTSSAEFKNMVAKFGL